MNFWVVYVFDYTSPSSLPDKKHQRLIHTAQYQEPQAKNEIIMDSCIFFKPVQSTAAKYPVIFTLSRAKALRGVKVRLLCLCWR